MIRTPIELSTCSRSCVLSKQLPKLAQCFFYTSCLHSLFSPAAQAQIYIFTITCFYSIEIFDAKFFCYNPCTKRFMIMTRDCKALSNFLLGVIEVIDILHSRNFSICEWWCLSRRKAFEANPKIQDTSIWCYYLFKSINTLSTPDWCRVGLQNVAYKCQSKKGPLGVDKCIINLTIIDELVTRVFRLNMRARNVNS